MKNDALEIEKRFESNGWVEVRSDVLGETVVWHEDDYPAELLPQELIPYSDSELELMFGADRPALKPETIQRLHHAKKLGMTVQQVYIEGDDRR